MLHVFLILLAIAFYPVSSQAVTLTFMHQNDLHAHLTPHADLAPDGAIGAIGTRTKVVERGGLARLATLVKKIRAENPNSVLMSVGDINNALTDILRGYGKTNIAVTPGFRFYGVVAEPGATLEDNTVANGNITLEDVYRFLPMPFMIATADVTGKQLRTIMEESYKTVYSQDPFDQLGGWTFGFSGLKATMNLGAANGARVLDMHLSDNAAVITDDSVVSVTGCRRVIEPMDKLCNFRGVTNLRPLIRTGTAEPWTGIDLLIEGISKQMPYYAGRRDITDISGIPTWPQSPWVQPLAEVP